ncbi:Hypp3731 [Branchiostoma lanceolatum]|uniref:Hypp3731 protein n=1 Tax=Branchiostoma lanceolatum TaxID=7740 RepID=A0A8K0EY07_BRALA|nr:Hypp3731 [Branchiostoma lanceolatum]
MRNRKVKVYFMALIISSVFLYYWIFSFGGYVMTPDSSVLSQWSEDDLDRDSSELVGVVRREHGGASDDHGDYGAYNESGQL